MSTILKALQRLEDEKSANVERSLDEQIVANRPPSDPDRRGLRIGAVAIGGLAVAAAVFFFWPTREGPVAEVAMEPRPLEAAPVAAIAQEVAAEKPRRRPSARPAAPDARAQRDLPEREVASIVEVVKRLDAQPADSAAPVALSTRAAPIAKTDTARPARRPSARKPDSQVAGAAARPRPARKQVANAELPATRISENSAAAKIAPALPAPVEIAAVAATPAPTASITASVREPERKVVQRAKLPSLSVEKTIWHPDVGQRVAIVKLVDAGEVLRLKEGDAVGPLVVQVIRPGSVLFNHDGIEIQYNVGG